LLGGVNQKFRQSALLCADCQPKPTKHRFDFCLAFSRISGKRLENKDTGTVRTYAHPGKAHSRTPPKNLGGVLSAVQKEILVLFETGEAEA